MSEVKININNQEIVTKNGTDLLRAVLQAGIYIPALCDHPDLKPVGYCGLSIVEITGQTDLALSCIINPTAVTK